MGPPTLFDKSFIQSLTVDESVWFDRYFLALICPIFYVETFADLGKDLNNPTSAERLVRIIAEKFPEVSGSPCADHIELATYNLVGQPVPMDARIPRQGGRVVKSGGCSGVVYDRSKEEVAFSRWQQEKFQDIEREYASGLRKSLAELDLTEPKKVMQSLGATGKTIKTIDEAKLISEAVVKSATKPFEILRLSMLFLKVPEYLYQPILKRWLESGRLPLNHFAPYSAFVLMVEIFFQLAVAADLISSDRPSNRVDIAYLFYLPFCELFVSNDKLHRKCAPLFFRPSQQFIWGPNLKADLQRLNAHYMALPEDEREKGVMAISDGPPKSEEFLTTRLHDQYFPGWRNKKSGPELSREETQSLVAELRAFVESKDSVTSEDYDLESTNSMSIQRQIRRRKGNWWQVPKNLASESDT